MNDTTKKDLATFRHFSRCKRTVEIKLINARRRAFGKCVVIRHKGTRVKALIVHEAHCPADMVSVLLACGHSAWYPFECVEKLVRAGRYPDWTKSQEIQQALTSYRPLK